MTAGSPTSSWPTSASSTSPRTRTPPWPSRLPSDFDQMREKWVTKPLDYLTSGHVSPSGDRVVLVSRGHVFVAPVGDGRWVRVSRKEGVRARAARFLGDGKSLMVLYDETGEWEFHRFAADGLGPSEQLTTGAKVIRFDGVPSPDGKWIAFADKDYQLWLFNAGKKALTRIARFRRRHVRRPRLVPRQPLARLRPGRLERVQPDHAPRGRDGPDDGAHQRPRRFLQPRLEPRREVALLPVGPLVPERRGQPLGAASARAVLRQDDQDLRRRPDRQGPLPLRPGDGAPGEQKGERRDEKAADAKARAERREIGQGSRRNRPPLQRSPIELAGIQDRVFEVPLPASVYSGLAAGDKTLFFVDEGSSADGPAQAPGRRDQEPQRPGQDAPRGRPEFRALGRRQEAPRPQGRRRLRHRRRDGPADRADARRAPRRSFPVDLLRRPARGVAADVRRRLADGARLLLRPQSPQRRLPGPARTAPAVRRPRQRPGRAQRPPGPPRRRALGPAHLRPRRRPETAGRQRLARARSGRASSATKPRAVTGSSTSSGRIPSIRTTCPRSASRCRPSAKARSSPASTAFRP